MEKEASPDDVKKEIFKTWENKKNTIPDPEPHKIIGEAFKTYIIVEKGDQLLLIDKNGNKETSKTINKFMDESGIISFEYQITNEAGLKVCHGPSDVKKPTATERFTSDLQINADKLVLSIKPIR